MTTALRRSLREKRRLHRLALRWPVTYHTQYLQYRDQYNRSVKAAREAYYEEQLQACTGDVKGTWKYINSVMGRKKVSPDSGVESPDQNISKADFINPRTLTWV